jgi:hypothetical protein
VRRDRNLYARTIPPPITIANKPPKKSNASRAVRRVPGSCERVQNAVTAWMLQTMLTVMVANISRLLQASAIITPMSIDTVSRHRCIPLFTKNSSKWESRG